MSAYIPKSVGSSPKAPLDPGSAAFVKGKPAMSQPAKNVQYYLVRIAQLAQTIEYNAVEYRKAVAEFKASGVWKEQYKTWGRTCRECLGISPSRGNELIRELTESYETDKDEMTTPPCQYSEAHELATLNTLPNPMDALMDGIAATLSPPNPAAPVGAPKAKVAPAETLENGESVADYKRTRATPTESGKPKKALALWTEIKHGYGHLLNRIDQLNHACPNTSFHRDLINQTKSCMDVLAEWKAVVK